MKDTWGPSSSGREYESVRVIVAFVASWMYVVKLAFKSVFARLAGTSMVIMSPEGVMLEGVMPLLLSQSATALELSALGATRREGEEGGTGPLQPLSKDGY